MGKGIAAGPKQLTSNVGKSMTAQKFSFCGIGVPVFFLHEVIVLRASGFPLVEEAGNWLLDVDR